MPAYLPLLAYLPACLELPACQCRFSTAAHTETGLLPPPAAGTTTLCIWTPSVITNTSSTRQGSATAQVGNLISYFGLHFFVLGRLVDSPFTVGCLVGSSFTVGCLVGSPLTVGCLVGCLVGCRVNAWGGDLVALAQAALAII